MSGDDDRERRSWRDIDRRRDGSAPREERQPRTRAEKERAGAATRQYLKQIDGLFSKGPGGAGADALAREIRDAHGTPALAQACRAYLEAAGPPRDPSLLSLLLDAGEAGIVLAGLEGLRALGDAGTLALSRGQKTQLRLLAQDANDDVAEAAEELLADFG